MTEVWNKKNPKKTHKKLTPEQKSKAKSEAKKSGSKYPSLVANMRACKEETTIDTIKRIIHEDWNKNK